MSALPPKADIAELEKHVRFVPKADIDCLAGRSRRNSRGGGNGVRQARPETKGNALLLGMREEHGCDANV